MSKNQINKYVWLVETLYHAKKITLKEINRRWLDTDLSEGLEENREVLEDDGLQRWLLSTMSVNNTLLENKSLSDRILLENIPSGQDFLDTVMAAMKKSKILEITYKGYWKEHENTFKVAPYCVKLFRQRWYMVGNSVYEDKIRIYSLNSVQKTISKAVSVSFATRNAPSRP